MGMRRTESILNTQRGGLYPSMYWTGIPYCYSNKKKDVLVEKNTRVEQDQELSNRSMHMKMTFDKGTCRLGGRFLGDYGKNYLLGIGK